MSKRQENWKTQNYTDEQIETHLKFERNKSKESRKKRKINNIKNEQLIKKIKGDLKGRKYKNIIN